MSHRSGWVLNIGEIHDIEMPEDGRLLHLFFNGGIVAKHVHGRGWILSPVVIDGKPKMIGIFSTRELQNFLDVLRVYPIIYVDKSLSHDRHRSSHRRYGKPCRQRLPLLLRRAGRRRQCIQ